MNLNLLEQYKENLIGQELFVEILECENKERVVCNTNIVVNSIELNKISFTNIIRLNINNSFVNVYFENYKMSEFEDVLDLFLHDNLIGHLSLRDDISWNNIFEIEDEEDENAEEIEIKKELLIALLKEFDCENCIYDAGGSDCLLDETEEDCPFIAVIEAIEFKEDN